MKQGLLCQWQRTGSGKTLGFLVPAYRWMTASYVAGIRTLIMAPTRELATQIHDEAVPSASHCITCWPMACAGSQMLSSLTAVEGQQVRRGLWLPQRMRLRWPTQARAAAGRAGWSSHPGGHTRAPQRLLGIQGAQRCSKKQPALRKSRTSIYPGWGTLSSTRLQPQRVRSVSRALLLRMLRSGRPNAGHGV